MDSYFADITRVKNLLCFLLISIFCGICLYAEDPQGDDDDDDSSIEWNWEPGKSEILAAPGNFGSISSSVSIPRKELVAAEEGDSIITVTTLHQGGIYRLVAYKNSDKSARQVTDWDKDGVEDTEPHGGIIIPETESESPHMLKVINDKQIYVICVRRISGEIFLTLRVLDETRVYPIANGADYPLPGGTFQIMFDAITAKGAEREPQNGDPNNRYKGLFLHLLLALSDGSGDNLVALLTIKLSSELPKLFLPYTLISTPSSSRITGVRIEKAPAYLIGPPLHILNSFYVMIAQSTGGSASSTLRVQRYGDDGDTSIPWSSPAVITERLGSPELYSSSLLAANDALAIAYINQDPGGKHLYINLLDKDGQGIRPGTLRIDQREQEQPEFTINMQTQSKRITFTGFYKLGDTYWFRQVVADMDEGRMVLASQPTPLTSLPVSTIPAVFDGKIVRNINNNNRTLPVINIFFASPSGGGADFIYYSQMGVDRQFNFRDQLICSEPVSKLNLEAFEIFDDVPAGVSEKYAAVWNAPQTNSVNAQLTDSKGNVGGPLPPPTQTQARFILDENLNRYGVKVSWRRPAGKSGRIRYDIYREDLNSNGTAVTAYRKIGESDKTSFFDTQPIENMQFTYSIKAIRGLVESDHSEASNNAIIPGIIPPEIEAFVIPPSGNLFETTFQVRINVRLPHRNPVQIPETSIEIFRSQSPNGPFDPIESLPLRGDNTIFFDTKTEENNQYFYRARAVYRENPSSAFGSVITSDFSRTVFVFMPQSNAPGPQDLTGGPFIPVGGGSGGGGCSFTIYPGNIRPDLTLILLAFLLLLLQINHNNTRYQ